MDIYQRLWRDYNSTEVGFMMPLYIARVYHNLNKPDKVRDYLDQALVFYREISQDEGRGQAVQLNAYQAMAAVYTVREEWDSAIDSLKSCLYLFARFDRKTPRRLSVITKMLNSVFVLQLKDFDRGIAFYEQFITDHPDHGLNPFIQRMAESLRRLKEKTQSAASANKQS